MVEEVVMPELPEEIGSVHESEQIWPPKRTTRASRAKAQVQAKPEPQVVEEPSRN